jgi:hypothetical protein
MCTGIKRQAQPLRSKKIQTFFGDLELNKFQGQQQDMLQWNTPEGPLKFLEQRFTNKILCYNNVVLYNIQGQISGSNLR